MDFKQSLDFVLAIYQALSKNEEIRSKVKKLIFVYNFF
jgi:hypothetical protein